MRYWTRKDAFVDHYNRLVDERAKGRLSRLVIRPDGNVVHEVDDWAWTAWLSRWRHAEAWSGLASCRDEIGSTLAAKGSQGGDRC